MKLLYVFKERAPVFIGLAWRISLSSASRLCVYNTDSRAQLLFAFLTPGAEGLDKLHAAIRAAITENPLIGPAFASMMVNFTPQADWVRVNATYK